MNEQILKLYKQAQEFAYKNISKESWNTDNFHAVVSGKFAELIVAECINVSEAHAKNLEAQPCNPAFEAYEDGIVNGIYEATAAIKEHFGVEE
jgi:hypothetical protein